MNEQNNIPQVQEILIGCISPSPMNPRKTFNEDALRELAENIRQQGLLQPITVRHKTYMGDDGKVHRIENDFEIVCGERRYRACKMISDIMEIPCIVRDLSDDEAFDAMITENLQRKDIDPIEEAQAFTALRQRGQQVIDIATRFGRTYAYVSDRIRLAQLKEPLRLAVSAGRIPLRGGYLLARLNEDDQQAFIDDEYDEDCDYTISDIEEWLDRHFMNLWNAPFHDGESLQETWNPDGKLIRRCDACDCNTNNHGCLFADMKTDEPQCIDELCRASYWQVSLPQPVPWLFSGMTATSTMPPRSVSRPLPTSSGRRATASSPPRSCLTPYGAISRANWPTVQPLSASTSRRWPDFRASSVMSDASPMLNQPARPLLPTVLPPVPPTTPTASREDRRQEGHHLRQEELRPRQVRQPEG